MHHAKGIQNLEDVGRQARISLFCVYRSVRGYLAFAAAEGLVGSRYIMQTHCKTWKMLDVQPEYALFYKRIRGSLTRAAANGLVRSLHGMCKIIVKPGRCWKTKPEDADFAWVSLEDVGRY